MSNESVFNRLSIQVPDYDTRMNMGTPDPGGPSGSAPFGYTGFGVHTNFNFFVDVGRVGLYQSNLGSCWQVGGKWLQWSNGDMYMATMGNNTVAADNKMLVAAGAGMGQITALTSAGSMLESPRLVEYNNLALHWRVDGIQVALKEFFYGKSDWKEKSKEPKALQGHYSEADADGSDPGKHYPSGFLKEVDDFLKDVNQQSIKTGLLNGFEWEGDRFDMTGAPGKGSYFSALEPFDPYPPTPFKDGNPFSALYGTVIQTFNMLNRFVDCMKRIGLATTDNPIGKRFQAFLQFWQDGQGVANNIANGGIDLTQWSRPGGEADTFMSHAPNNTPRSGSTAAQLTSKSGPWIVTAVLATPGPPPPSILTVSDGSTTTTIDFSRVGTGGLVTVDDLKSALDGNTGNSDVDSDGSVVTITHHQRGSSSTLTVSGPLAALFFGANSTTANGRDETTEETVDKWRTIQTAFSSYPEDLRDMLRPLYQGMSDLVGDIEGAVGMVGDLASVVVGQMSPPSMLGLIAKDGITLGSANPIYGTGGGISFVATNGTGDPDKDKFVTGIETAIKYLLDGDDPGKSLFQTPLVPESKLRKDVLPGNFRVAAQNDVVVTAKGKIMQVALDETVHLSQKHATLASKDVLTLRSYKKTVDVVGKNILIGDPAPAATSKQEPTGSILVASKDRIDLRTDKLRAYMGKDTILVGKNDPDKLAVFAEHPHLTVHTADTSFLLAGYWAQPLGGDFFGLDVQKGGDVRVTSESKVSLAVKDGGAVEVTASAVNITKDLKVGSVLLAKGDGSFSRTPPSAVDRAAIVYQAAASALQTRYQNIVQQATELAAQLDELISAAAITSATRGGDGGIGPLRSQLRQLWQMFLDLLTEARTSEVRLADIGWQPSHDDLFARRSSESASA